MPSLCEVVDDAPGGMDGTHIKSKEVLEARVFAGFHRAHFRPDQPRPRVSEAIWQSPSLGMRLATLCVAASRPWRHAVLAITCKIAGS